jgi:hypothetical protein
MPGAVGAGAGVGAAGAGAGANTGLGAGAQPNPYAAFGGAPGFGFGGMNPYMMQQMMGSGLGGMPPA